jgi:hypothetical protein
MAGGIDFAILPGGTGSQAACAANPSAEQSWISFFGFLVRFSAYSLPINRTVVLNFSMLSGSLL